MCHSEPVLSLQRSRRLIAPELQQRVCPVPPSRTSVWGHLSDRDASVTRRSLCPCCHTLKPRVACRLTSMRFVASLVCTAAGHHRLCVPHGHAGLPDSHRGSAPVHGAGRLQGVLRRLIRLHSEWVSLLGRSGCTAALRPHQLPAGRGQCALHRGVPPWHCHVPLAARGSARAGHHMTSLVSRGFASGWHRFMALGS